MHNAKKTCWNCPAAIFKGNVDFRACGQSKEKKRELQENKEIVIECKRRPELGHFEPSISFEQCPEWIEGEYGYMLKDMKVMILGIDGYLGWTLGLKLGSLGFDVSGVDNYKRRDCVMERGSHTIVPIAKMTDRLQKAKEELGVEINFRKMDINNYNKLKDFLDEVKPEAIVHYAEIPSAPYSMISRKHAIDVQRNNILGTLNLLFAMKETVPETSLIKLGCYDDQTEILTRNGWKLFRNLEKDDEVATRSKDNRTLVFKRPNSIHEYKYKGNMYYQNNTRLDFCVTPNHRIFTQKRSNNSYKELRLESVEDVEGERKVYDVGFEWDGEEREYFILPAKDDEESKKIPMALWLTFIGWFLSEGWVNQRKDRPNNYRVCIKQDKESSGIDEIEEVMLSLSDILGREMRKKKERNCFVYCIGNKQLASYLDRFGKAGDKYIPKEIKQLSNGLLNGLLFSLIAGDGWKHRRDGDRDNFRYFSISKQLADDVQEIALKCGYGAIVSYSEKKEGYCVYICQTPRIHVNHQNEKTDGYVDYDGKVYCVAVGGDGIVFVRRNGRPVWSGNTMGELGQPLTGRPIFEGLYPADATVKWDNREWSLGGEITPRDPASLYHASKVSDSYNIYELCKYWWLRSYDLMQGVIYGVHTDQVSQHPDLRTRLDVGECVPPETSVITNFDNQPISNIQVGDKVLAHSGKFRKVTRIFQRSYSGQLIKIKTAYSPEPITVTSNHPLLVVEKRRKCRDYKDTCEFSEPKWMSAQNLLSYSRQPVSKYASHYRKYQQAKKLKEQGMTIAEISRKVSVKYCTVWAWFEKEQQPKPCTQKKRENLYLVKPIPNETKDVDRIDIYKEVNYGIRESDKLYTPNPVNPRKKWGHYIPAEIKVDKDFLSFVGYYLAEGCTKEYQVILSFGKHEKKLIKNAKQAIQSILGKVEEGERDHAFDVRVSSKAFAKLTKKLFNSGADNKKMPDFFLHLPLQKQKIFIKSYWEGDGWETKNRKGRPQFHCSSNSKILLYQLQLILLRFGIISGIVKRERECTLDFEGREKYAFHSKQWQLYISGFSAREFAREILGRKVKEPARRTRHAKRMGGKFLLPIRKIWEEPYEGEVLNLEVQQDNSYTANGCVVHNCFGTVVNRFVSQAISGIPLTVYGEGGQIRGFIALEDAMECMTRLIVSPPEPGQYDVINQVSGVHKIRDLAETVAKVGNDFDFDVEIQRLENPRVESEEHPFEVVSRKLPNQFGFRPKVTLEKEIGRMFELLSDEDIKKRIEEKKHTIIPKIRWDLDKRESETLEQYKPGTKKSGGYKGVLKRD